MVRGGGRGGTGNNLVVFTGRAYASKRPTVRVFQVAKHEVSRAPRTLPEGSTIHCYLVFHLVKDCRMVKCGLYFSLSKALDPGYFLALARHHVLCTVPRHSQ